MSLIIADVCSWAGINGVLSNSYFSLKPVEAFLDTNYLDQHLDQMVRGEDFILNMNIIIVFEFSEVYFDLRIELSFQLFYAMSKIVFLFSVVFVVHFVFLFSFSEN